nr:integrase, catalytic region, zinc finger, CCHC-type, peptidase aspartic, catalytic [Tanacetum cinerariifolium]
MDQLLKIDVAPLALKLRNIRTAQTDYLRHTQEETATLREIVESERLLNPLNTSLDYACTVKFRNDHVAKIMGYSDYKIGNVTILRVYFVERLGHNLFSVGQFCGSDLEVAFCQHTCFIRNLDGADLLTGSRRNNLYTLSLKDTMAFSPIYLLSKASKTKSWLWHRRLSHLNFVIPPIQVESTDSPSSTLVDQDAPSPSKSQTTPETQYVVIPQDVEEENIDIEVAHIGNDPLFCVPIPEVTSAQSSSMDLLFQSMFDELLNPPPSVDPQAPEVIALITEVIPPIQVESTNSPSSTLVDQDAHSPKAMQEELNEFERLVDSSVALTALADADHAGCQDTHRSTSGSLYHFIKEQVENGVIELYFLNTEYQLADLFTKALGRDRIEFLINKLGMRSFTPETLRQLMGEVDEYWWCLFKYLVSYDSSIALTSFADVDHAGCQDTRRSTSGSV